MGQKLRVLRPDDLVVLDVELVGLSVQPAAGGPVVDADGAGGPERLLVFTLPPQHIAEQAYRDDSPDGCATPPPPAYGSEVPDPPGAARSRLAGPSRVVFSVPDALLPIPLTIDDLLAWHRFTLVVPPASRATPAAPPPIAPPAAHETAIELPWRLVMSPEAGSGWTTAASAVARAGRTELWRAALGHQDGGAVTPASSAEPVAVRAVWSPDWRSPDRTWADLDAMVPFRSLPNPAHRHELVTLMSGFSGYEVYEPSAGGGGTGGGGTGAGAGLVRERVAVPRALRRWVGDELVSRHRAFEPRPAEASRLFLSALGASVRLKGQWDDSAVPAPHDRFERVRLLLEHAVLQVDATLVERGPGTAGERDRRLAEALERHGDEVSAVLATAVDLGALLPKERAEPTDLSLWSHDAVFGRDQYVVIATEGALFPTGHRAVRIDVMERRIERPGGGGAPVSNLFLYTLVIRRQRLREIRLSAAQARGFPFGRRFEVLTERTPHLTDPATTQVGGTQAFWIQVSTETSSVPVAFACASTDAAPERFTFTTPMIFVPMRMWEKAGDMAAVADAYTKAAPVATVGGQRVTMAAPAAPGRTETAVGLNSFTLAATAGAGGPNAWVPIVAGADVVVPDIAKLSGPEHARRRISFDPGYVASGPAGAGVWATVAPEAAGLAGLGLTAAAAGGVALPEFAPSALSRELGPTVASAVAGTFNPAGFFPGNATLFGVVPLKLLVNPGAIAGQAPKVASHQEPGAVVTELSWAPSIDGAALDLPPFVKVDRAAASLDLRATIRRSLDGTTGTTTVTGVVRHLAVTIAGAVRVDVAEFRFTSTGSDATTVDVKLGAVEFVGPLGFLADVQEKLQAFSSLLGGPGGPTISVDAGAVRVDEAIALPPFGLAVFSLHDVRLTTGVTLPLVDGRPALRFGVADRHHPFVLTISLLGGGGYLELEVDTAGIRALDAAIEFGGEFQLDIGVASGGVRIMAGIYFTYDRDKPSAVIGGFFEASGYVSVLGIVTVSVVFRLELGYDLAHDKVHGSATVKVSVSVCGISKSVSLSVERSFGADGGDPDFAMLVTPAAWDDYVEAFA